MDQTTPITTTHPTHQSQVVFACVMYYRRDKKDCYVHRLVECLVQEKSGQCFAIPVKLIREKSDEKEVVVLDSHFENNAALLAHLESDLLKPIVMEKVPKSYTKPGSSQNDSSDLEFCLTSYRRPLSSIPKDCDTSTFIPCPSLFLPAPLDSFLYPQSFLIIGIEKGQTKISFRRLREWMRIYSSLSQYHRWNSFEAVLWEQNKRLKQIWDNNSTDPLPTSDVTTCIVGLLPKRALVPPERVEREEFHEVLSVTCTDIIINQEKAERKKQATLASKRSSQSSQSSQSSLCDE